MIWDNKSITDQFAQDKEVVKLLEMYYPPPVTLLAFSAASYHSYRADLI
jgi:hypothetical protein